MRTYLKIDCDIKKNNRVNILKVDLCYKQAEGASPKLEPCTWGII